MKGGNAALVEASCQRCIHHHMVAWGLLFPLASLMFGTHSLPMRQKWPGVAHLTWVVKMRSRSGGISHILFACNINPPLPHISIKYAVPFTQGGTVPFMKKGTVPFMQKGTRTGSELPLPVSCPCKPD